MKTLLEKSVNIAKQLHQPYYQPFNVYAFIFSKKRLISVGKNDMIMPNKKVFDFGIRFNVPQFKKFPFRHAEIDAISRLWGKTRITGNETMVVVRLKKDFSTGLAKPCPSCMEIIDALGISKIQWTI